MTESGNPLILATSSSALFDLAFEDNIFRQQGEAAYAKYQIEHENVPLSPGYAFPLISKLLKLNTLGLGNLVQVILLSRNSADTGLRVMNAIAHHKLAIDCAAFTGGINPYVYARGFGASLFLSANRTDVAEALASGMPAAAIVTGGESSPGDQIRIAFDGDAVLFSDAAERIFREQGLEAFNLNEKMHADIPMEDGPLLPFLEVLHQLQNKFVDQPCPVRTALCTARSAPAHERVIRTLRSRGVRLDEALFLGGRDKSPFVKMFNADIFFDDHRDVIKSVGAHVASAHVISGINNPPGEADR